MDLWFRFVLAVLAVWRVSHLLSSEDGPADLIVRLRRRLGEGLLGQLMDCFYCLSVWTGAAAAFFVTRDPVEWVVTSLALSGAACLLERATAPREPPAPLNYYQGESSDVLWTETSRPEERDGNEPSSGASPSEPAAAGAAPRSGAR